MKHPLQHASSNTARFTASGTITLRAMMPPSACGEHISLDVFDTAIGMTPEQTSCLLQGFSQANVSTALKHGGAGLVMRQRFIRMMGGEVGVSSELERSSTFGNSLPANVTPPPDNTIGEIASGSPPNTDGTPRDVILVIDDDAQVRELMTRFLTKEGWQVVTAATAGEGLSLAQQMHPAAITLDANVSGADGWSVLTAIKANPALTHIPIILVTLSEDAEHGYTLGVADFLTKPIDWGRLSVMLGKYRGNKTTCRVLVIDDDAANRGLLNRMATREGWTVSEAANGRAALKQAMNFPPDLILLDLMMPEMDGFEVVRLLRTSQAGRSIPVVAVTAKDLTADDRRQLSGAVERIILKGAFRKEELLEELRSLVSAVVPPCRTIQPDTPAVKPIEQPASQPVERQREPDSVRCEQDAELSQVKENSQWEQEKAELLEQNETLEEAAEEARRLLREQQHTIELLQAECDDAAGIAEDIESLRDELARLKAEQTASLTQANTVQDTTATQLAEATATQRQLTLDLDTLRQENKELKEELTRVRQERESAATRVKKKKKKKKPLPSVVADTPPPEPADSDVWHIVYQDEAGQSHKMTCSTAGIRMWVAKGLLRDLTQTLASRSLGGPFNPLSSFPEFRDLQDPVGPTQQSAGNTATAIRIPADLKSTTIASDDTSGQRSVSLIMVIIVLIVGGLAAFFGSQFLMND
jgi:CheY-like chemotaxis protein